MVLLKALMFTPERQTYKWVAKMDTLSNCTSV